MKKKYEKSSSENPCSLQVRLETPLFEFIGFYRAGRRDRSIGFSVKKRNWFLYLFVRTDPRTLFSIICYTRTGWLAVGAALRPARHRLCRRD